MFPPLPPPLRLVIGLIVLLGLAFLSWIAPGTDTPRWIRFIGRFHPVILQLPIGLFAGVVLLELAALFRWSERKAEAIRVLALASFLSSAVAVLCGALLAWEGGYDKDALASHKWAGWILCALFFCLYVALNQAKRTGAQPGRVYQALLAASLIALGWTGHQGGSLTHGSSFLTEHLPFRPSVPPVALGPDASVFDAHVGPIFQDYCVQCHGAEKSKADLKLDSFAHLKAGGVTGPAMVAGDSERSLLIRSMLLSSDHKDRMPPKGKPQPKADDIAFLRWWIDQGASPTAKLADLRPTPAIAARFTKQQALAPLPRAEIERQLTALANRPELTIRFLARDNSSIEATIRKGDDADVEALLPMRANVVRLDLARSTITDQAALAIGQMTNLTALHLEQTAISDRGVEALAGLQKLELLNLYGTRITDAAIPLLSRMPTLRRVYLWQTGVTPEGGKALQRSLQPELEAERIRLQIADLTQAKQRLAVEVVAGTDTLIAVEKKTARAFNLAEFMKTYHRGDSSLAQRARSGDAEPEELDFLLRNYQQFAAATPSKGDADSWRTRSAALVSATEALLAQSPDAIKRYGAAVNCKACHDEHR